LILLADCIYLQAIITTLQAHDVDRSRLCTKPTIYFTIAISTRRNIRRRNIWKVKTQQKIKQTTRNSQDINRVKQAVHLPTNNLVAIKIVLRKIANPTHLNREIIIHQSIKHDRIIQLWETIEDKNHVYLVLELAQGGELFDKISKSFLRIGTIERDSKLHRNEHSCKTKKHSN